MDEPKYPLFTDKEKAEIYNRAYNNTLATLKSQFKVRHRLENELLEDCYHVVAYYPTGSRYICSPAPVDTDEDFVVLLRPNSHKYIESWMSAEGYECNSKVYAGSKFWSFKGKDKGTLVNFITTEDSEFYNNFIIATEEAKERNLLKKEDRINLFKEFKVE